MIKTKLILIEGLPCSGKSTTAINLANDISACGIKCKCFLEWSENNPVFLGKMEDLPEIISTTMERQPNVLRDWKNFTKKAKQNKIVNIIESRFWQTHAMYLYLSGHSEHEIIKNNQHIISIIPQLNPVLIYLALQDIRQMLTEVARFKNKKWQDSGREGSWEQWGNQVYEQQKWFKKRSLKGSQAVIEFFNEWALIADRLYESLPFRKIKIKNPQHDWELTMNKIRDFLNINK